MLELRGGPIGSLGLGPRPPHPQLCSTSAVCFTFMFLCKVKIGRPFV